MSTIPSSKTEFIVTFEEAPLQAALAAAVAGNDDPGVDYQGHKGIRAVPSSVELNEFLNHHFLFQRRYKLENDTNYRHPIPYGVFYRVNANNEPEFFVYQRTKQTGEGRLSGKHSIGIGGHVDLASIRDILENSLSAILADTLNRELDEEFNFQVNPTDESGDPSIGNASLFINSDFSQDQFHLGLVPITRMPDSVANPTSLEADNVAIGFFTLEQIREQFLDNLESWSQLIVNEGDLLSHVRLNTTPADDVAQTAHEVVFTSEQQARYDTLIAEFGEDPIDVWRQEYKGKDASIRQSSLNDPVVPRWIAVNKKLEELITLAELKAISEGANPDEVYAGKLTYSNY